MFKDAPLFLVLVDVLVAGRGQQALGLSFIVINVPVKWKTQQVPDLKSAYSTRARAVRQLRTRSCSDEKSTRLRRTGFKTQPRYSNVGGLLH
ncbi:hypothetical protein SRHO_G00220140 [Serrasalmus rhombeus]